MRSSDYTASILNSGYNNNITTDKDYETVTAVCYSSATVTPPSGITAIASNTSAAEGKIKMYAYKNVPKNSTFTVRAYVYLVCFAKA